MKKWICSAGSVLLSILCAATAFAADDGLVAWWQFERLIEERVVEPFEEEDEEGALEEEIEALEEETAELEEDMVLT